jgi:hypothetical protein
MLLQPFEGFGEFSEGCTIAQSAGLALDDRQIVTPVIDGLAKPISATASARWSQSIKARLPER